MKTIDLCEQWFRNEGLIPSRLGDDHLLVKYQRLNLLVEAPTNDQNFLRLILQFGKDNFPSKSRTELLEVASTISKDRKVIKGFVEKDDGLSLSAEVLLDTTPVVEDILPRLLDMLYHAFKVHLIDL